MADRILALWFIVNDWLTSGFGRDYLNSHSPLTPHMQHQFQYVLECLSQGTTEMCICWQRQTLTSSLTRHLPKLNCMQPRAVERDTHC